ncbi:hypothetical protein IFM89_005819 [Coptis chinensis]|uniref:ACT domain-containing protein n=1 Tax=Coptis chinensis TaxID=261450 RepID=A0A835LB23_9MAGN|nr:hypothetical protein IFM89_005819 [Coptis chinensis]
MQCTSAIGLLVGLFHFHLPSYEFALVLNLIYHSQTSIVFSLEEGPGVLFKALAVFAMRQINLTKIESRPRRKQPMRASDDNDNGSPKYFDYLFYVDFEASMADPNSQNALRHLEFFDRICYILESSWKLPQADNSQP